MRILAVDDDLAILELLGEALAVSGYTDVVTAGSGEAAIDVLCQSETPFDCFLLDIQMPGMDGVELCQKIRKMPEYSKKPIVMVTAMSQKSYIDRAFSAGATDYITKPFDFMEVGMRLNLAQKQVEDASAHQDRSVKGKSAKNKTRVELVHSLCEPIEILGIDHVVGYVAFDNYVLQLTRSHLFLSSVYAVKIAGIEQIYAKSSTLEFKKLVTNVARNIVDCTDPMGSLLSYRGNGVFLCMNHKGSKQAHLELEQTLHAKARLIFGAINQDGNENGLQLILGEQVALGALFRTGSLAYLRRAIENVESKALFLKEMDVVLHQENTSDQQDQELQDQRKVGYEAFLRESLMDANQLQPMRQS